MYAVPQRPNGLTLWQMRFELGEVHTVASKIRSAAFCVNDAAPSNSLRHHLGDSVDLGKSFARCTDIERLIVHDISLRLECRQESPGDVLHVDKGSPRRAVALD